MLVARPEHGEVCLKFQQHFLPNVDKSLKTILVVYDTGETVDRKASFISDAPPSDVKLVLEAITEQIDD